MCRRTSFAILAAACSAAAAGEAEAQLEWSSKDESMSFKLGVLAQLQAESVEVAGTGDEANNLFFRRLRLMGGFRLSEQLALFGETDSPNLGKAANDGTKNEGDIFIQDFVATWKFSEYFLLDGGLLLTELSYNHNQSAASLLTLDYGAFSFVESVPITSRVGRDYGVRARGYLAGDHLEYRAGIYQGDRGTNASDEFRYVGRLMYQFFTPQKGLFYRGTSLGQTRTLAFGASYDTQQDYDAIGADVFFEQPFGAGNGLVLQADYVALDGGDLLPTLPERTTLLLESGFYFAASRLQPFVQFASQDLDSDALVDERRYTVGLAYFHAGHNLNLKAAYTRSDPSSGDSSDQIDFQWQVFQF